FLFDVPFSYLLSHERTPASTGDYASDVVIRCALEHFPRCRSTTQASFAAPRTPRRTAKVRTDDNGRGCDAHEIRAATRRGVREMAVARLERISRRSRRFDPGSPHASLGGLCRAPEALFSSRNTHVGGRGIRTCDRKCRRGEDDLLALGLELTRRVPGLVGHFGILLDDLVHLRDRAIDLLDAGMLLPARRIDGGDDLAYFADRHDGIVHAPLRLPGKLGALLHARSEEHTSELQSRENLVCRLLLEKKNNK